MREKKLSILSENLMKNMMTCVNYSSNCNWNQDYIMFCSLVERRKSNQE